MGFHGDVDAGALRRHSEHRAVVHHFQNIAALRRRSSRRSSARTPGRSANEEAHDDDAFLAGQFAHHDRGGEARVDIAPGEDEADAPAAESAPRSARTAARPAAPAPSAMVFCSVEIGVDRLLDGGFADQHHVVDQAADDRQRQLADILDRDAFGERFAAALDRRTPLQRRLHGRDRARSRRRSTSTLGLKRLDGDGDAGDQPAAADRHDQASSPARRPGFPDRWCPGRNDMRIVIGMDEDGAASSAS